MYKGYFDNITNGEYAYIVKNIDRLKRCGGIGDVLAGLSCVYSVWGNKIDEYSDL